MTQEERNNLGQIIGAMAVYYSRNDMTPAVISMYLDDLEELSFEQAVAACREYRRNRANTRFPLPAQLLDVAKPQNDPKQLATLVARKIDRAVAVHGWTWAEGFWTSNGNYWEGIVDGKTQRFGSFKEAVIAELGEIAWHAIVERGGWQAVRDSAGQMQEGQFIAQMRDQVEASYSLAKSGVDVTRVEMPKLPPREESKRIEAPVIEIEKFKLMQQVKDAGPEKIREEARHSIEKLFGKKFEEIFPPKDTP